MVVAAIVVQVAATVAVAVVAPVVVLSSTNDGDVFLVVCAPPTHRARSCPTQPLSEPVSERWGGRSTNSNNNSSSDNNDGNSSDAGKR